MSYEKQTWQTGDVVTSAKLNHMEDGIAAGGVLVVNVNMVGETPTCDKTAGEMAAAYLSGGVVVAVPAESSDYNDNYYLVVWAEWSADGYYHFHTTTGIEYSADTASDYPTGWVP